MSSQLWSQQKSNFHHQVSEAQGHLQINLDPDSESYLVRLLYNLSEMKRRLQD